MILAARIKCKMVYTEIVVLSDDSHGKKQAFLALKIQEDLTGRGVCYGCD